MKRIRTILEEYNAVCGQTLKCLPYDIMEVLSPDSNFWKQEENTFPTTGKLPWSVQRSISQAFLVFKRASEEMDLLKKDMERVLSYWKERHKCIERQISAFQSINSDLYSRGAQSLLGKLMWETQVMWDKSNDLFTLVLTSIDTDYLQIPADDDCDEYEDSDSESDYE